MFVKINPLLGSNTDPRNRTINVMRAIRAVATAAANTTPECYVVRDPGGTLELTNNMITVISNEEAGGWTVDTSSSVRLPENNTYVAACTSAYHIHLYSNTGKTTYPYKTFTYRTNPNYSFNNTFVNYPASVVYYGISNSTAYSATYHGFINNEPSGNTTTLLYDWNGGWNSISNTYLTPPITANHYPFPFQYACGEFYLSVTSDYLIGIQSNSYLTYCGTRYTQAWEDSYNDNPPVVGFHFSRLNSPQGIWGWSRYRNISNTGVSGPTAFMHKIRDNSSISTFTNTFSYPLHPISGASRYVNNPTGAVIQYGDRHSTRMLTWSTSQPAAYPPNPLFYSSSHVYRNNNVNQGGNWNGGGAPYAPVYDSNSQIFVPPAVPMVFQFYGTWFNSGGRLKGIYKSLSGSNTFIGQYAVADQDFSVPNDSAGYDTYRIIACAPNDSGTNASAVHLDTFLVRNA